MSVSPRCNLELKARCSDLAAARQTIGRLGARFEAVEEQCDTYFHVPHGRLKLREIDGRTATLIWYERPDREEVRASAYYLVPVADAGTMHTALAAALGVRGEVRKRREVYLWHNVRIHLDQVADLGSFVELEAVVGPEAGEAVSRARLEQVRGALGLAGVEQIAGSYGDLMGARGQCSSTMPKPGPTPVQGQT